MLSARLQKLDRAFGQTRSAKQDAFVFDVEDFSPRKGEPFSLTGHTTRACNRPRSSSQSRKCFSNPPQIHQWQ